MEGGSTDHIWPLYRYAEVLLNYAEAMNEAYGPDADPNGYGMTARQALTEVRQSASTSLPAVTATSKTDFRNAVKQERRVELAFEDHRYWDLLRWKDAMSVLNKAIKGASVRKNELGGFQYTYPTVAYFFSLLLRQASPPAQRRMLPRTTALPRCTYRRPR